MGRIFEVRKAAKFARYDRMAKQFTRVGKEIVIAVKGAGPEPENNPALRRALQNAKGVNMPKDRIEAAISRALGKDTSDFQELLYEGYAPHGVAILVTTATDNAIRTVAKVRAVFSKYGGSLGTSGSVRFQFEQMGVFYLDPEGLNAEDLELELIDYGLEEMGEGQDDNDEDALVIRVPFTEFGNMQKALEDRNLDAKSSEIEWIPTNTVDLDQDQADEVLTLIGKMEEEEDVQKVFHNLA